MRIVTLVNRTSKTLHGTWDGKHYDLAPGKHAFPEFQAMKFKEQNPLMGSEDPYSLQKQYLLGIEDIGDDISPIEQSDARELFDRKKLNIRGPVTIVTNGGLYQTEAHSSLPLENAFVIPD